MITKRVILFDRDKVDQKIIVPEYGDLIRVPDIKDAQVKEDDKLADSVNVSIFEYELKSYINGVWFYRKK